MIAMLAAAELPPALQISASGLIFFLAIGVGLFALVRGARYLVSVSRLSKRRKAAFQTGLTVFATVLSLGYIVSAVPMVFTGRSEYSPYYALLVAAALLWVGWVSLRDLLQGIFFKAARATRVGEQVTIGDMRGRVSRLGYRVLALTTARGQEVLIPWGEVVRKTIIREPASPGAVRHTFVVAPLSEVPLARVTETARRAAFNCHWASASRETQIELLEGGELELGVYALDALYGREIEASVRDALARLAPPD
jgi:small-conductance mechanosensitive channel